MSSTIGRLFGGAKKASSAASPAVESAPIAKKKATGSKRRVHTLVPASLMKQRPAGSRLNRQTSKGLILTIVTSVLDEILAEMSTMPVKTLTLNHARAALFRVQPATYAYHIDGTIMEDPANVEKFRKRKTRASKAK